MTRRGGVYHFRRQVPDALRPALGLREISRSLGTVSPREAARLAHAAWVQIEGIFRTMGDDPDAVALVRALIAEPVGASVAAISIENDIQHPPRDLSASPLRRVHDAIHAMLPVLKPPEIRNIEAHLAVLARIHESAVQGQEAALAVDRVALHIVLAGLLRVGGIRSVNGVSDPERLLAGAQDALRDAYPCIDS